MHEGAVERQRELWCERERGSVAVVLLVLLVITVLAGTTVERAISTSRSGRAEQDRLLVRSALDIGVAEATAKLDAGQTGPFAGSGGLSTGVAWWYHAAPVSGGYRVNAAATAGAALHHLVVIVARTTAGGWAPSSSRQVAPSSYALAVLSTPGLRAYWRLDETGGASFADASGNGLSAAISGGVSPNQAGALSASGDGNGAALFNGVDGGADAGDHLDFTDRVPYTVSAWINPTGSGSSAWQFVLSKDTGGGSRSGWTLVWGRDGSLVVAERFAAGASASVSAPATAGTWIHAVATYDGSTLRLYLDGVERGADATATQVVPDTTATLALGTRAALGRFSGRIDEPAVWDRALSAVEVARLYAAGSGGTLTPPS